MSEGQSTETGDLREPLAATSLLGGGVALGVVVLGDARPAFGIALGTLLAALNLWALGWVVRGLLNGSGRRAGYAVLAAFKFAVLVGAGYLALATQLVDALPLAIGYGTLPLGILVGQLLLTPRLREEV